MEAVKKDLVNIPNSVKFVQCDTDKEGREIASALSAFADVDLIAGARNAQRAFFPLCFIMYSKGAVEQLEECNITNLNLQWIRLKLIFQAKG